MDKNLIKVLNSDLLKARKDKNTVAKNLLTTLKGNLELDEKKVTDITDEKRNSLLQGIAKKMKKNLETIGTDESKLEIKILEYYLPKTLTEEEVKVLIADIDLGGLPNIGAKMGKVMKSLPVKVDGNLVREVLNKYYS